MKKSTVYSEERTLYVRKYSRLISDLPPFQSPPKFTNKTSKILEDLCAKTFLIKDTNSPYSSTHI
ncbi:MAG: hypothetical protein DRP02_14715 [Candidatus Gerdarchaeota archaeon]|nr:MAG: hypothetical protein DRP02_14715 [Candidatus Gerdarchaeota archaeon]